MSSFLTAKDLYDAIYDTIWGEENSLMIVSPYIDISLTRLLIIWYFSLQKVKRRYRFF